MLSKYKNCLTPNSMKQLWSILKSENAVIWKSDFKYKIPEYWNITTYGRSKYKPLRNYYL